MAPLWDFFKGQFVGVLSAMDFILILREVCAPVYLYKQVLLPPVSLPNASINCCHS